MNFYRATVVALFIVITAVPHASAKEWRGIVPLLSTRADVERTLGRPAKRPSPDMSFFDLKGEWVRVVYSKGPCAPSIGGEWRVPPGTVLRIEVVPKEELPLKDSRVDVSTYKEIEHLHITGRLTYVSEAEGFAVDTNSIDPEHELVLSFWYGPKSTEDNLRCKSPAP
jgi:hypothetical protein